MRWLFGACFSYTPMGPACAWSPFDASTIQTAYRVMGPQQPIPLKPRGSARRVEVIPGSSEVCIPLGQVRPGDQR